MRTYLLFTFVGVLACYSCSNSYDLLENDAELAKATEEYEMLSRTAVERNNIDKIETVDTEEAIQEAMDAYVTKLMNRSSIAKQKLMRTVYSTVGDVVGVFKSGSCGVYKELDVLIDAEDTHAVSRTENMVGDSFVDKNGNINFKFCLTEASQYYPGGVFLVDHINYFQTDTRQDMKIVVRYHDCDDKGSVNRASGTHPKYNSASTISNGYTKLDANAALAWAYPNVSNRPTMCLTKLGPKSRINYGLLAGTTASIMGRIFVDDEDSKNKNWAKLYTGYTFEKIFMTDALIAYGMSIGKNTRYDLTFSTDYTYFRDKNLIYYPTTVYPCN